MPSYVRPSYRLTSGAVKHAETGSPFDCTVPSLNKRSYQKDLKETKGNYKGVHSKTFKNKIAYMPRWNPPNTDFRKFYERGDLPILIDQNGSLPKISWKTCVEKLNFDHYLPLFFEGLRELEWPYCFLAERGVHDLIEQGGHKILPVIPKLIIPLKTALNTRDKLVVVKVLRVLQKIVTCDASATGAKKNAIGIQLVPYYRQLLPILNLYKNSNKNLGDTIDYSQKNNENLGDLIQVTLELFELHGGKDAFINLKYLIPTYQSIKN